MKISLHIDVSNLYRCIKIKYGGKLDYENYIHSVANKFENITAFNQIAYGYFIKRETSFIRYLRSIELTPKFTEELETSAGQLRSEWQVGICTDIFRCLDRYDFFILGTSNADFYHLGRFLVDEGKGVAFFGCDVAGKLKENFETWEITQELLEE